MKITLQSKPNSFAINDREFQKGYIDVNYRVDGTIGFGNTIKGTLDEITADGQSFGTVDELKEWVSANMFMGGGSSSGSGGSTDGLRIPAPPANGSFLLMAFDGKVEWIPN